MRFSRLEVENFKAIVSAELELGPGLNVLYGPNDLGKSTLGVALRAALLLPSTSSAADAYVPWHEQVAPIVRLTFLDAKKGHWRVTKRFTKNDATLAWSKDGREFSVDAHERAVDEKLRKLLSWGLPTPGGKGGARGMPESFLANALLAPQTDVAAILKSSLEKDDEPGGKVALTKALSALAQDPLVQAVLSRAQEELKQYFTATGKKASGRDAPLKRASEEVKALEAQLEEVRKTLEQSRALEAQAQALQEAWLTAQHAAEQAQQAHAKAIASQDRAAEKRQALRELETEQQALARAQRLAEQVQALDASLVAAKETCGAAEQAQQQAEQRLAAAREQVRLAEEAHRKATSAEGEAERTVARAKAAEAQSGREARRSALVPRLERARAAQQAAAARVEQERKRAALEEQLKDAKARLPAAQADLALVEGVVHYGHWRLAREAAQKAEGWRAEARALRVDAEAQRADAARAEAKAVELEGAASSQRALLPDAKLRATMRRLFEDLARAEASLGGGVSVTVKPRSSLLLRSTADEAPPQEQRLSRELAIDAQRRVQLSIGDLVDIEVIAGGVDQRKEAELLRARWRAEARPVLERAAVRNLEELDERFEKLEAGDAEAKALRETAAQRLRDAQALEARATDLAERSASAPTAEQVEERRRLVGPLDFNGLETFLNGLGATWETQTRALQQEKSAALAKLTAEVNALESDSKVTSARLEDLEKAAAPGEEVAPLEASLASLDRELAAGAELLKQLERHGSTAVKTAEAQLVTAKQTRSEAEAAQQAAAKALVEAHGAVAKWQGQRELASAAWAQADEPGATARVKAAEQALAAYADVSLLSAEELGALKRAADQAAAAAAQARDAHAGVQGELKRTGGPQAREQVKQLQEALVAAKAREHLLEVDADAWKLLVEAVKASEQEDSSGLGSALAGPVTTRFAELTKGRYGAVRFDPALKASGVELSGLESDAASVMDALSVGTRDHLATLIRLAIALQLESAIVLDDHLVHTDPARLSWFKAALEQTAQKAQVIVLTCRPLDYVKPDELPTERPWRALANEVRVIDLSRIIQRR